MQKMNLCTDGYFLLAVGGFDRCMRGGADKFWRELHREETPRWKNWRPMNEDEKKAEKKRKEKWDKSEKERLLRKKYKNGNYHKYPQKLFIMSLPDGDKENYCKSLSSMRYESISYKTCINKINGEYTKDGIYKKDLIESYSFNKNFQYKVKYGDKVTINYIGTLENGKVFKNSYEGRKKNVSFKIGKGREIKGLHRGILGMRLGGIREIVIPAELGYGKKGKGKIIPSNSTLYYVVELVKIEGENLEKYLKEQKKYYYVSPPPKKIEWR